MKKCVNKARQSLKGIAELPPCCRNCDFLDGCKANKIACADFAKWAQSSPFKKIPKSHRRIATKQMYELAFAPIDYPEPDLPNINKTSLQKSIDTEARVKIANLRAAAFHSVMTEHTYAARI